MAEKNIVCLRPRHVAEDAVDLGLEPHVEHAIRLVEHEDRDGVERHHAPVEQILQPTRRRDEDVSLAGSLSLVAQRHAAVDRGHGDAARLAERRELLGHLQRELTRRHEHERRGSACVRVDALDDGNGEGERLARAGR